MRFRHLGALIAFVATCLTILHSTLVQERKGLFVGREVKLVLGRLEGEIAREHEINGRGRDTRGIMLDKATAWYYGSYKW